MAWTLTEDPKAYLAAAGEFLRSRPAQNTVLLTVSETLRARGNAPYGEAALLGWWDDGGAIDGAFLHTPPHALLLSAMPQRAVEPLAEAIAARDRALGGVNAHEATARAFASAWRERTGATTEVHGRHRLYRLGTLTLPHPSPPGRPRAAMATDRPLLIEWYAAFARDVNEPQRDPAPTVDDRLGYGGLTLWEIDGGPVALAGVSRAIAGMVRVAPVYTPPEHRRRGYATAVTAAISRAALEAGAREVLLFTDLANPTTNRLYQRLGYRPVEDRLMLSFGS